MKTPLNLALFVIVQFVLLCSTGNVHAAKLPDARAEPNTALSLEKVSGGRNGVVLLPQKDGLEELLLGVLTSEDDSSPSVVTGPNRAPLDVIFVADTSASMDSVQRRAQERFIANVLRGLELRDRFRLAAIDVECVWFKGGESKGADENTRAEALSFLRQRASFGWTDLEKTIGEVFQHADDGTQIFYVGDGLGRTGKEQRETLAEPLRRLYEGKGSVHAIATGGQHAPQVLKAMAEFGGGTFWRIRNGAAVENAGMSDDPSGATGVDDAALEFYLSMSAEALHERLQQIIQPRLLQRSDSPKTIDAEAYGLFTALFRKSETPSRHVSLLQAFYRYTGDDRLLRCVVDGVVGLDPHRAYPLLARLEYSLKAIREEAPLNRLSSYVRSVRESEAGNGAQRLLDILEFQVESDLTELGKHPADDRRNAALSALQRAFIGDWRSGEPRMMAHLLARVGTLNDDALKSEQLRQLKALNGFDQESREDRLAIAASLGDTLMGYGDAAGAISVMEDALASYRKSGNGRLQKEANEAFGRLTWFLSKSGQHLRAEKTVRSEIKSTRDESQKVWLTLRLFDVYIETIRTQSKVSLGSGQELFLAVLDRFREPELFGQLEHRQQCVHMLSALLRFARDSGLNLDSVRLYALEDFPKLLRSASGPEAYQKEVGILADALYDTGLTELAFEFVMLLLDREMVANHGVIQEGWDVQGERLGRWRKHREPAHEISQRLFTLTKAQLRADLERGELRKRWIYARGQFFWEEKKDAFVAVAGSVWDAHRSSPVAARQVSRYLYVDIGDHERAIRLLLEAQSDDGLDDDGRGQLITYLFEQNRFEEVAGYGRQLIMEKPDVLQYRVMLMRAYFKIGKADAMRRLLADTNEHFREQGLWTETNTAALAESCLANRMLKSSAVYYDRAISIRSAAGEDRGTGDETLAAYYWKLAHARLGLRQVSDAVDAACGAIESWGSDGENRRSAVHGLQQVLAQVPGLDRYVDSLDAQVAEGGEENPVLRQALGWVYMQKRKFPKAVTQLQRAIVADPLNQRSHELLVKVYERSADSQGAVDAFYQWILYFPDEAALYEELARRLAKAGLAVESERVLTSMVDLREQDFEGHARLAGIRERQGRWSDALHHWQQVAHIRSTDPTGYVNLARLQIRQQHWADVRDTCEILMKTVWPVRFGNVHQEAEELLKRIPAEDGVTP